MNFIGSKQSPGDTAIALGLFDGIHLGHRSVIQAAVGQNGQIPTVLTFSTDTEKPERKREGKTILTDALKFQMFEQLGVQQVYCPDFTTIRDMEPEDFFQTILLEKLQAKSLVCGEDFRFGKKAAGDTHLLKSLGEAANIKVCIVPSLKLEGMVVSSTRIRKYLVEGQIEKANTLLGSPYSFQNEIVYGKQLGRTWGIPTINQIFRAGYIVPRYGVYASKVTIDDEEYYGVTNIGVKPTVTNENVPLAETHLIGANKNYYGYTATVSLLEFIRGEKKFDSIDALKKAIKTNIKYVELKYLQQG